MKLFLPLLLALSAFVLGACATTAPAEVTASNGQMSNAERYQRAVNNSAARKNLDVHWINPPDEDDLDEYVDEDETGTD